MRAAGVSLLVTVMVIVCIGVKDEMPSQIIGHSCICITGNTAEQLDASLCKCILCPCANAAAENNVGTMLYKETNQCTVPLTVGRKNLGAYDLVAFRFIKLELSRMTKVLKYLTVFVRNCDFHGKLSFYR